MCVVDNLRNRHNTNQTEYRTFSIIDSNSVLGYKVPLTSLVEHINLCYLSWTARWLRSIIYLYIYQQ